MRFKGRVALVTGASRGIGRATAIGLARQGADVAVHYATAKASADGVCDEVRAWGRRAMAVQADIADRAAVGRMAAQVVEGLGPIELLVNNAGDDGFREFDELTPDWWDRIIAVNLTGVFNVTWAVKNGMIARTFGRIVNVASIAAWAVRPNQMPYAAAKAGVMSLTKCCCEPLAPHNIRINAVAPGAIATDMLAGTPPEIVERLRAATPLQRLGEPEEIADAILFLLSEESRYITGTTIIVSGGRLVVP